MSSAKASNDSTVTSRTRVSRWSRLCVMAGMFYSVFLILTFGSCIKAPEFGDVPKIEFVSLSADTMLQGLNQEDSIIVTFHFEDGDGDIGRMTDSPENNVFFIDMRTGQLDNAFGIPFVPPQGSSNGIEGDVHIKIYSTCCIHPDADPCEPSIQHPYDQVSYQIYIRDRAGNMSNMIETPVITLICQ